jgi:hypothetical protein
VRLARQSSYFISKLSFGINIYSESFISMKILTLRLCASSNRLSASVFLSLFPDRAGEPRLLPEGEPLASSASSWNNNSFTLSRSRSFPSDCGLDLDLDFFFLLICQVH